MTSHASQELASSNIGHKLHDWVIKQAQKSRALWIFIMIAFTESAFLPVPPDIMLIPMVLSGRIKPWYLAMIGTIASVLGGICGYCIGAFLFESVGHVILDYYNLGEAFHKFQMGIQQWGFWIVSLKGLTPIPFKLVAIGSGLAKLKLSTFILAAVIARSFRFFMVAYLVSYAGPQFSVYFRQYFVYFLVFLVLIILSGWVVVKYVV